MARAVHAALAAQWRSRAPWLSLQLAAGSLAMLFLSVPASGAGLGEIRVQSALGQPLRASVALLGDDAGAKLGTCFNARLNTADGVFIVAPRIAITGAGVGASGLLNLSTTMALAEPAISLVVEMGCGDAIRKEFSLLLDPPMYLPGSALAETPAAARTAPRAATAAGAAGSTGRTRRRETDAADSDDAADTRRNASARQAAADQPAGAPAAKAVAPRPAPTRAKPVRATDAPDAPRASGKLATAPAAGTPPKNVLRLSARDGSDVDLVNAIGLRLAMADRLADEAAARAAAGSPGAAAGAGAAIPDLAKSAADRAARARFAAALRDQPEGADPALQATEQKLQDLQAKMQRLEAEAERLRQPVKRDAGGPIAVKTSAVAATDSGGFNWLPILGGVLAIAVLVIGWLLVRMKRLQQNVALWDWEENVAAADERATDGSLEELERAAAADFDADPFAPAASGPGRHASPAATAATAAAITAAALPAAGGWTTSAPTRTGGETHAPAGSMPSATPSASNISSSTGSPTLPAADPIPAAAMPAQSGTSAAAPARPHPPRSHFVVDDPLEFKLDEPAIGLPAGLGAAAAGASGARTAATTEPATRPGTPGAADAGATDDLQFTTQRNQPAVEEISDAMQEAEFWISLHDSQRAVEVLEPYATADQPGSPLPWLYLFDLYRELGQRSKYERLHERFQRIFNGKILSWVELDQAPSTAAARSLEDMPHLAQKIATLWQSEQIVPYLESLLLDDRDGSRVGFDLSVYREIMFLIGMAYELQQSKKFIKPAIGTPGWTLAA